MDMEWVEEGRVSNSSRRRKLRPKRFEFVGWGSRQLIEFLQSLGRDTTKIVSQHEVSEIILRYIAEKGLLDSSNKKKVFCDKRLFLLFGSKSILKIKVFDLLEKHYEENQDDPEFDFLYEDEPQIVLPSEKRDKGVKKVVKKPKGAFAAIVSENVKLVYLRKSLVEELVKSPDSFESKMLGSFVRIKSDPNDYLQKNPKMLVQVTGVKKEHGTDDFLLQVTNYVKDVSISMLSDDNFSKEECEDLHERIKNGFLKKPTIVEMEEKAQSLHEDQTKHWLGREIALLERLIARANEKGWRRELSEYLDKRELLKKPEEQARLLSEIPEVIEEELVPDPELPPEASPEAYKSDNERQLSESPISSIQQTPEPRNLFGGEDQQCNGFLISKPSTIPSATSYVMELDGQLPTRTASAGDEHLHKDVEQTTDDIIEVGTPTKDDSLSQPVIHPINRPQAQPNPPEIIELSDDDDDEEDKGDGETLDPRVEEIQVRVEEIQVPTYDTELPNWLYKDPKGIIQGPFSLAQLKQWNDAEYFAHDFKIWTTGQTMEYAVLLTSVLRTIY